MGEFIKQHLIDPEICIRCHTCEEACPINAITHDDNNVVVDAAKCDYCMACVAPCPTGAIDNWRVVRTPYALEAQLSWMELPEQETFADSAQEADGGASIEALDDAVAALLAEAHAGAGGAAKAPASASKPTINLHNAANPISAMVQGNYRLTAEDADSDVRHIILDLGARPFPVLEGQSVGITPPGTTETGKAHTQRLYSISSPRDGERPNTNNLSLTVKREPGGLCSNYVCDLKRGDAVQLTGPYGATFLMPSDPQARIIMVCTGTGSAPFRAFTMRRQRTAPETTGTLLLFFGARTPDSLPYFGPLKKVPDAFLAKRFAFSRVPDQPKRYVQDALREAADALAPMLQEPQLTSTSAVSRRWNRASRRRLPTSPAPRVRTGSRSAQACGKAADIMSKRIEANMAERSAGPGPDANTFVHEIRVGWADCDPADMAYTGRIPNWALEAIDAWWEATTHFDWYRLNLDRNVGTPFVHMTLDFRSPITPRHRLACEVSLLRIGGSSVRHRVRGFQDGTLCFEGEFVAVFVVADQLKPRKPPEDILALITPELRQPSTSNNVAGED